MRSFSLHVSVNDALAYTDRLVVPDGGDVRYHDVAIVLRALLASVERRGSDRVPTESDVAALQKRVDAAHAVLAEWEATLDGVSVSNGVASRVYRHVSGAEAVAVCAPDGTPTLETADTLAKWKPEA